MRTAPFLLFLFVAGCMGPPFAARSTCHLAGGATLYGEAPGLDCAAYQRAADFAREAVVERAGFASPSAYAGLEAGTTYWVHAQQALFRCSGGEVEVAGCEYTAPGGQWVELQARPMEWVHEMLHGVDQLVLHTPQPLTAAHTGWGHRGAPGGAAQLCPPVGTDCYLAGSWWDVQMHSIPE